MAELFHCSWAEGSDYLNTGASTENVWNGTTGTNNFSRITSDGWNSESHCLEWNGTSAGSMAETGDVGSKNVIGCRFAFKVVAENLSSGNSHRIATIRNLSTRYAAIELLDDSGTLKIQAWTYDTNPTIRTIGSIAISSNTWYQIEIIWKRGVQGDADLDLTGFGLKVWNEAGSSLEGSASLSSSYTVLDIKNITRFYVEKTDDTSDAQLRWDIVKCDDADWVGPEIISSAGGVAPQMFHLLHH